MDEDLNLVEMLAEIRQGIVRLGERAKTNRQLQMAVWKIWGHCRNNQGSLDSEKQCAVIEEVVHGAVSGVQQRAEELAVQLDAAKAELRKLRVKKCDVSEAKGA